MSIFGRRKRAQASDPSVVDDGVQGANGDDGAEAPPAARAVVEGPKDSADAPSVEGLIDLGSLRVPAVQGTELRLEIDQQTQAVLSVAVGFGESVLQLQPFAAPKTLGLWDEIRDELAKSVSDAGGTADDVDGPQGRELRARMPMQGPDGRTVFMPARFLGHDGPRWFLRGVLSGRAVTEDEAAEPLLEVFRRTVVVRGPEPMAPRELLPLRMPDQGVAAPADEPASTPDLNPFERGPEITEVR